MRLPFCDLETLKKNPDTGEFFLQLCQAAYLVRCSIFLGALELTGYSVP